MNTKILASLVLMGIAISGITMGTVAYFSDVEKSVGNTFTAGTLDLKVDSQCSYNGVQKGFCTWSSRDLTDELFFKFNDVKPGDYGEDTISLKSIDNDAWICAYVQNLANQENGCNEPEQKAETAAYTPDPATCGSPGIGEGELQNAINIKIWLDVSDQNEVLPCDNIQQPEELVLFNGPIDSNNGVWNLGQIKGNEKTCLGVEWSIPSVTGNIIQSDSVTGDIAFYAEQVRHNEAFKCPAVMPTE